MEQGVKMTHAYFSSNEWVTYSNGRILFEDNVRMSIHEFWADRRGPGFDNGWSEFKS